MAFQIITLSQMFKREREREREESWGGVVRETTVLEGGVIET
jgi:hypothetical protein